MTPKALIKEMLQRGLRLSCEDGKLLLHGNKSQMDEGLMQQLKTNKSVLVEMLRVASTQMNEEAVSFPLSCGQQEILPIALSSPKDGQFNLCSAVILKGQLDQEAADRAASNLLQRHASLRTKFSYDAGSGESRQEVFTTSDSPLQWESWPYLRTEEGTSLSLIKEYCHGLAHRPFDLGGEILLRIHLCNLYDDVWLLVMVRHHICSDGWSFAILVKDFCHAYELAKSDAAAQLPQTSVTYQQFVMDEQRFLQSHKGRLAQTYWQEQSVNRHVILVPFDVESSEPYGPAGVKHFRLADELQDKAVGIAAQQGMSLYCVLFTVFNTLLLFYRLSQDLENDSFCVGTDVTMRDSVGLEQVVGLFVNRLQLSFSYDLGMQFSEALIATRNVINRGMQNKAFPRSLLTTNGNDKGASNASLFSPLFGFHNNPHSRFSMDKLTVTDSLFFPPLSTNLPLTLYFTNQDGGLIAELIYRQDRYFERTVGEFIQLYSKMLETWMNTPDISLTAGYAMFCEVLEQRRMEQRRRFQRKSSKLRRSVGF